MHRIRVYADTSVFGGVYDVEFAEVSTRFFEQVRQRRFVVLLSPLTMGELQEAPRYVLQVVTQLLPEQIERIPITGEVSELAQQYVDAGVLGEASIDDATHVAAATIDQWSSSARGRSSMKTKTKTFDCVEMKHEAQKKLRAEYNARKDEFDSYPAFLEAKSRESDWQRDFWAKIEAAGNTSE